MKSVIATSTAYMYLAASASECVVFSTVAESYIYIHQYEDPHLAIDAPLGGFLIGLESAQHRSTL